MQGHLIVGVVPVGVNLRVLPLRGVLGVVPVGVNLRAFPLRGDFRNLWHSAARVTFRCARQISLRAVPWLAGPAIVLNLNLVYLTMTRCQWRHL